jgi:hypothetical protein
VVDHADLHTGALKRFDGTNDVCCDASEWGRVRTDEDDVELLGSTAASAIRLT